MRRKELNIWKHYKYKLKNTDRIWNSFMEVSKLVVIINSYMYVHVYILYM